MILDDEAVMERLRSMENIRKMSWTKVLRCVLTASAMSRPILEQVGAIVPLRAQQVVVPVLAVGKKFVPYWFIRLTANHYKKNIAAELETALSIITTAYLCNEDIQTAVEENIDYLNPPVRSVVVEFLTRIKLVDPDVVAALQDMGT